jgi:hypothetical protein
MSDIETRAKLGGKRRSERESESYPYDSYDIEEAYIAGYEDGTEDQAKIERTALLAKIREAIATLVKARTEAGNATGYILPIEVYILLDSLEKEATS